MGVSSTLMQSTQEEGPMEKVRCGLTAEKGCQGEGTHTDVGSGGTGVVLEMTRFTGRTDIQEGSPPGPNHPGKSRGLVLPQQSLGQAQTHCGGIRTTHVWLGGYAPRTLPPLSPKSLLSSPSQLCPWTKPQQLHKPHRPAAPTQALLRRQSQRLAGRSSRPDDAREEARGRRPDPSREEG